MSFRKVLPVPPPPRKTKPKPKPRKPVRHHK